MRRFLSILVAVALLVMATPLMGCAGQAGCGAPPTLGVNLPSFKIPPPLILTPTPAEPVFAPSAWAQLVQQPAVMQCAPVQQQQFYAPQPQVQQPYYYAPSAMPRAASDCGGGTWSPPPVPGDPNAPPDSIPANK